MATDTTTSIPTTASGHLVYTTPEITMGADPIDGRKCDRDDASSSLSELGERPGHEEADNSSRDSSDAHDTEAETERLEDSPQKRRKHQNIVLTMTNGIYENRESPPTGRTLSRAVVDNAPHFNCDGLAPTSDISSPVDSGDEICKALSTTPFSRRKRKRSSFEDDSLSDPEPPEEPTAKLFNNTTATLERNTSSNTSAEEDDQDTIMDMEAFPTAEQQATRVQQLAPAQQKYEKGKRKGKKIRDDETETLGNNTDGAVSRLDPSDGHEITYSNGEDVELDEAGDLLEADNLVKNEEGAIQKKTALDSLHAMERCFATLRDKIFDERLAQCNEELAMLEHPVPTHPELLAMKEVLDQRRDQKIDYEQILMENKLQTLQRESVANKTQAHSQYMQTVREVRDTFLDRLNKDFYQLQRERRSCEGDVPDLLYEFNTERVQQVKQQTAYNAEVSILSGIARYVGFPAAPDIGPARPKEIEDDFRHMGLALGTSRTSKAHRPGLNANASAAVGLARQSPAAGKEFIEQNAWANPQHPAHQQHRQGLQRQFSQLSRAATPVTTPARQVEPIDLTGPRGSSSTIAVTQSGPSPSVAPTTATGEASRMPQPDQYRAAGENLADYTQGRRRDNTAEATPENIMSSGVIVDKGKGPQLNNKSDQSHSPSFSRNKSQEVQTPSPLSKSLPVYSGASSSTPGARVSTPVRYPIIKAEDASHLQRHSTMPHQYHTPAAVSTVANGQNRF